MKKTAINENDDGRLNEAKSRDNRRDPKRDKTPFNERQLPECETCKLINERISSHAHRCCPLSLLNPCLLHQIMDQWMKWRTEWMNELNKKQHSLIILNW